MSEKESYEISTPSDSIKDRIYTIRGMQVMLDSDLAELYQVETRIINQAVKRNQKRFPEDFCFKLTDEEVKHLKSQFVISSLKIDEWGGVVVKYTDDFHDRFMLIDGKELYSLGASIKDAGIKGFAINRMEDDVIVKSLINYLKKLE